MVVKGSRVQLERCIQWIPTKISVWPYLFHCQINVIDKGIACVVLTFVDDTL